MAFRTIKTLSQGISHSLYNGGCACCKKGEGKILGQLPTILDAKELYFHGFICQECEKKLGNSKKARISFCRRLWEEWEKQEEKE